ncbi:hypothetical protein [Candidatus Borreliella tachyglossi]|uniref:hypothetical protein n=1 Tax=Candidatus Borreliella tachyglossi TaxID=1964448 RepID=UPI0040413818
MKIKNIDIIKTLWIILLIIACTTVELTKEYKTSFEIIESHAQYISIDNIEATNKYIYIEFTNKSSDIVKINWQHTNLNSKNIVTTEDDIKLINNPKDYYNKYKEFFIGPETSQKFTIYLLGKSDRSSHSSINKSEIYNDSYTKIQYPAMLKLNIVKTNINTNKTIDILILRTPKSY